jgi:hypothetical protein
MIPNENNSSLLMSEELMGQLDIEDDEKKILQDRSCIVVIKIKMGSKNDMLLGHLCSMGIDVTQKLLNIELGIKQSLGLDFLDAFWSDRATIHGIEIHRGENVVVLFKEQNEPHNCTKCNIYDVSIQNEECTLLLSLTK